jgi:hypothetical protein
VNCPTHNIPLQLERATFGLEFWVCPEPGCDLPPITDRQIARGNAAVAAAIAKNRPVRQATQLQPKGVLERARDTCEKDLVRSICQELEAHGFVVLQVGQLRARGSGTTVGTPDLFAARPPVNQWVGMEVKLAGGQVRVEQQALVDLGVSIIVRSVDEAVAAAERTAGL